MAAAKKSLSLRSILLQRKPSSSGQSNSQRWIPPRYCLLPFLFTSSIFFALFKFPFLISISKTPSSCPSSSSLLFRPAVILTPFKNKTTSSTAVGTVGNLSPDERAFWQQPDSGGFRPCLQFSLEYRKASSAITTENRRFLMVVVSGELGQQKNGIVDAVVIARILGAALVLPFLDANSPVKNDSTEFGDIFDVEHFKETLRSDVRIVSSLPSSHLGSRAVAGRIAFHATPLWIRSRFRSKLSKHGVLLLKDIYSKLSRNLPLDLQRLRCKVAFQALRFAAHIRETGSRLAERMRADGPYIALHLRLEKDVWIQTGCLPGLSSKHDALIAGIVRRRRLEAISSRWNMSHYQRRLTGLCPLNADDVARLLKALGAPGSTRVYWGGGTPLGGALALKPLAQRFPRLTAKEELALPGELEPFLNRPSALEAVDYTVFLGSDVFMASHKGSMAQAIKGHRYFAGHRKFIEPNKRAIAAAAPLPDLEFVHIMKRTHQNSLRQPEPSAGRQRKDVTAYPTPECICKRHRPTPVG
ncbi:unnamed protein product [Victoria cruziana]